MRLPERHHSVKRPTVDNPEPRVDVALRIARHAARRLRLLRLGAHDKRQVVAAVAEAIGAACDNLTRVNVSHSQPAPDGASSRAEVQP